MNYFMNVLWQEIRTAMLLIQLAGAAMASRRKDFVEFIFMIINVLYEVAASQQTAMVSCF